MTLQKDFITFYADIAYGFKLNPVDVQAELGSEIHALACCSKPLASWIARNGIQESRECCGGHGYLKAAKIGTLRDDHDPNMTHEGECYVMLQQTSNYLMRMFQEKMFESPLHSVDFISNYQIRLQDKMRNKDFSNIDAVIEAYEFLVCHLLVESEQRLKQNQARLNDAYAAKSESQIYHLISLATVYFEGEAVKRFQTYIEEESEFTPDMKSLMNRMNMLFGLWSLEKHLPSLFDANYFKDYMRPVKEIRDSILKLCSELKNDAVALVDVFAPPDFILNSCLGYSDGRVYEHIFEAISNSKGAFDRPDYYKEFTELKPEIDKLRREPQSLVSKL